MEEQQQGQALARQPPSPPGNAPPQQESWAKRHPWTTLGIGILVLFILSYALSKSSLCKDKNGKQKDTGVCKVANALASIPEGILGAIGDALGSIIWLILKGMAALGLGYLAVRMASALLGKRRGNEFRSEEAIKEAVVEGEDLSLEFTEDGDAFWVSKKADGTKEVLQYKGEVAVATEEQVTSAKELAQQAGGDPTTMRRIAATEARLTQGPLEMTEEKANEAVESGEASDVDVKDPLPFE